MEFETLESLDRVEADAIVVGISEAADSTSITELPYASVALPLFAGGDLPLKPLETLIIPGTPKIVFIGIAKAGDSEAWRRAAAAVVRRVRKVKTLAFSAGDAAAIAVAPPAMSYFIFSMPSAGFRLMPPESNVTPFPT